MDLLREKYPDRIILSCETHHDDIKECDEDGLYYRQLPDGKVVVAVHKDYMAFGLVKSVLDLEIKDCINLP